MHNSYITVYKPLLLANCQRKVPPSSPLGLLVCLWRSTRRIPPGRAAQILCLYRRESENPSPPLLSEFRRVLTAKCFGPGKKRKERKIWLDIWKSWTLCRGLPELLSPEIPQCSRRLQTARLYNKETVSGKKKDNGGWRGEPSSASCVD